jgi:DNA replication and repair protein RecF
VHLSSVRLTEFRNYSTLSVALPADGALFRGDNGAGKTNLLEAVHLLCLGRSQRGCSRSEMIRREAQVCCVEGTFVGHGRQQAIAASIGFDRAGALSMMRDGQKVATSRQWFGHCPVVSFGPTDQNLVNGPPADRRRFVDMLASQVDPEHLGTLLAYQRGLLNRNRLLAAHESEAQLDAFENSMAIHGGRIFACRQRVMALCQGFFGPMYGEISAGREAAAMKYEPSVPPPEDGVDAWGDVFYKALKNKRKRDLELRFSSVGPHRDDVLFSIDKWPARSYASQGQSRSLALAARLSSVLCLERCRSDPMIFLVDDAFSELDDRRIAAVYPLIRQRGQVLMATPTQRTPFNLDLAEFLVCDGAALPL